MKPALWQKSSPDPQHRMVWATRTDLALRQVQKGDLQQAETEGRDDPKTQEARDDWTDPKTRLQQN